VSWASNFISPMALHYPHVLMTIAGRSLLRHHGQGPRVKQARWTSNQTMAFIVYIVVLTRQDSDDAADRGREEQGHAGDHAHGARYPTPPSSPQFAATCVLLAYLLT